MMIEIEYYLDFKLNLECFALLQGSLHSVDLALFLVYYFPFCFSIFPISMFSLTFATILAVYKLSPSIFLLVDGILGYYITSFGLWYVCWLHIDCICIFFISPQWGLRLVIATLDLFSWGRYFFTFFRAHFAIIFPSSMGSGASLFWRG